MYPRLGTRPHDIRAPHHLQAASLTFGTPQDAVETTDDATDDGRVHADAVLRPGLLSIRSAEGGVTAA
jgi:hypothetical protein